MFSLKRSRSGGDGRDAGDQYVFSLQQGDQGQASLLSAGPVAAVAAWSSPWALSHSTQAQQSAPPQQAAAISPAAVPASVRGPSPRGFTSAGLVHELKWPQLPEVCAPTLPEAPTNPTPAKKLLEPPTRTQSSATSTASSARPVRLRLIVKSASSTNSGVPEAAAQNPSSVQDRPPSAQSVTGVSESDASIQGGFRCRSVSTLSSNAAARLFVDTHGEPMLDVESVDGGEYLDPITLGAQVEPDVMPSSACPTGRTANPASRSYSDTGSNAGGSLSPQRRSCSSVVPPAADSASIVPEHAQEEAAPAATQQATPPSVTAIPTLTVRPDEVHTQAFADKVLSAPIILLKRFLDHSCGLPAEPFSLPAVAASHAAVLADVLHQSTGKLTGWRLPMQTSYKMPLAQFVRYVDACQAGKGPALAVDDGSDPDGVPLPVSFVTNPNTLQHYQGLRAKGDATRMRKEYQRRHRCGMPPVPPHPSGCLDRITTPEAEARGLLRGPKPRVQYAVNCDMKGAEWAAERAALEAHLPAWMHACGHADAFALAPEKVDGMNVPQMYIKVAGSSTAAHEENNRFYSVNHNHGPGESEWGAVAAQHVSRLRAAVLAHEGVDIYAAEGRYFPDEAFCATHGIPLMRGRQGPGDSIVLQGGTVHWVKALGPAVHTSWNYAPLRAGTFAAAIARRNANAAMRPVYPSYVAVTSLCHHVAAHLMATAPLQGISPRNLDRVLMAAAGAMEEHRGLGKAAESIMTIPGACRDLPSLVRLLRVLLQELQAAHRAFQADCRALQRAGVPLSKEPRGSKVFRCQNPACSTELYNAYVVCNQCLDLGQVAILPPPPKAPRGGAKADATSHRKRSESRDSSAGAFFVTPPPGRTDVAESLQNKLCVPSLVAMPEARKMEAPPGAAAAPCCPRATPMARLERCRKRHRAWRDGNLKEVGQVTCAPIMCTKCALGHMVSTSAHHHQLEGHYKFSSRAQDSFLGRISAALDLLCSVMH